jgi:hypothetical protein
MTPLRLYVDEDSMDDDFVKALRVRGVDVHTTSDDGMRGRPDRDQLRWSTAQGRVLYSFNVADFYALHADFLQREEQHAGIILAQQQRYSIGDQLRGVLKLMAARSADEMVNQLVFLSAWI